MKRLDINTVIACGLVVMGVIAVVGWLVLSYRTGASTGTEIPIGVISGLTGVLTGKKLAEAQTKVTQTMADAQKVIDAVEALTKKR